MIAFLSPIFSAKAPKMGAPKPQARFCIAMARLNSALGHPNCSWMGIWKTPNEARIAKPTRTMIDPTTRTGVNRRGPLSMVLVLGREVGHITAHWGQGDLVLVPLRGVLA